MRIGVRVARGLWVSFYPHVRPRRPHHVFHLLLTLILAAIYAEILFFYAVAWTARLAIRYVWRKFRTPSPRKWS
jgi:hypothetical protein